MRSLNIQFSVAKALFISKISRYRIIIDWTLSYHSGLKTQNFAHVFLLWQGCAKEGFSYEWNLFLEHICIKFRTNWVRKNIKLRYIISIFKIWSNDEIRKTKVSYKCIDKTLRVIKGDSYSRYHSTFMILAKLETY